MYKWLRFLGILVLILSVGGLILLASAGGVNGGRIYGNEYHFVVRQGIWLLVAFAVGFAASRFDYHHWRDDLRWHDRPWLTILLYAVVVALMLAVFLFPATKGSQRWVGRGIVRVQPSELAKLAVVVATAVFIDRAGWRIEKFWKGTVRAVGIVAILMGLALLEPDFGAALVIGLTGAVLFFISGMRILHLVLMFIGGVGSVGTLLWFNPNRMNRILAWLPADVLEYFGLPVTDHDASHQLTQALVAIKRGGVLGVGFNQSMQKQQYLPEAHTDFIFAIGAEECGLVFSLVLLALFVAFFVCGMVIAAHAPDRLGRLMAYGMSFLVFFQALFNISVVTGCLPTKGIALPFISYGGTNLITVMTAVGVLFNVGRQIGLQNPRPRSKISPVFSTQGV